jgi:cell division protein FtsW
MVLPDAHSISFRGGGRGVRPGRPPAAGLCFAFIVLRALSRMVSEHNMFVLLGVTGLATGFGLQAVINMASSLHLMPTKGMTLPFIRIAARRSLAIALGVGMLLALTRKRFRGASIHERAPRPAH